MKDRGHFVTEVLVIVLICSGGYFIASPAIAQSDSDSNQDEISVGTRIIVTAPANQSINHDETNTNQSFPTEQWEVKTNNRAGATFDIDCGVFVNQDNTDYWRPARLNLSNPTNYGSWADWSVTTSQSTDDTDDGSDDAVVSAESTLPGGATFDLDVTFVEDTTTNTIAPSGTYQTTITGTLTAK